MTPFIINPAANLGADLVPDPNGNWPDFPQWIELIHSKITQIWISRGDKNDLSPNLSFPAPIYRRILEFTKSILAHVDEKTLLAHQGASSASQELIRSWKSNGRDTIQDYCNMLGECISVAKASSPELIRLALESFIFLFDIDPQSLSYLSSEAELPRLVGLVTRTSGSQQSRELSAKLLSYIVAPLEDSIRIKVFGTLMESV